MRHQEETLAAYVTKVRTDEASIAVVLNGSLAKGTEREDSDVDVYLVVTDAAFAQAEAQERLSYVDREVRTYDAGYVDIKLVTKDYLRRAALDGDDPVRASFVRARVAWSRDPEVAELVAAIPVVSQEHWDERCASFIAQVRLYAGYFLRQGEELGDPYLLHWAAVHAVAAAGRALLARGHVLFQGNKYLTSLLGTVPDLPEGYLDLTERLVTQPRAALGGQLLETLENHHDWPLGSEQSLSRFVRENELSWLTRIPPPEFR